MYYMDSVGWNKFIHACHGMGPSVYFSAKKKKKTLIYSRRMTRTLFDKDPEK